MMSLFSGFVPLVVLGHGFWKEMRNRALHVMLHKCVILGNFDTAQLVKPRGRDDEDFWEVDIRHRSSAVA